MCACAAQPRSGLAPMIPTRILFNPSLLMLITLARSGGLVEHVTGDLPAIRAASEYEQLPILLGAGRSSGHNSGGALRMGPRICDVALHRQLVDSEKDVDPDVRENRVVCAADSLPTGRRREASGHEDAVLRVELFDATRIAGVQGRLVCGEEDAALFLCV